MSEDMILRAFPDMTIALRTVKLSDREVEVYVLLDIHGKVQSQSRSYDELFRRATVLQDMIERENPPKEFVKTPLLTVNHLNIFRTVRVGDDGRMRWTYVAENSDGVTVASNDSLAALSRAIVVIRPGGEQK